MELETERLTLRPYCMQELENYFALKSSTEVWKYSTTSPVTDKTQAQVLLQGVIDGWHKEKVGFCALYEKGTQSFIGEAGILTFQQRANRCVIGYNLLPDFWGQGYGTEIAKALLHYAFETMQAERVEALAMCKNVASCRVLEKAGLLREGVLRHFSKVGNEYFDVAYYGCIKGEYQIVNCDN